MVMPSIWAAGYKQAKTTITLTSDRVKGAPRNRNALIPVMQGQDKTLKAGFNKAVGLPLRQIGCSWTSYWT